MLRHNNCISVVRLSYPLGNVDHSLTLTMNFSNLWKHCYRFTHAFFHSVYNYTWPTPISSVTVSLHYLPRCMFKPQAGLPFSDYK